MSKETLDKDFGAHMDSMRNYLHAVYLKSPSDAANIALNLCCGAFAFHVAVKRSNALEVATDLAEVGRVALWAAPLWVFPKDKQPKARATKRKAKGADAHSATA